MPLAALLSALPVAATAQEHIGVVRQPQTVAPSVAIPGPQAASCGPAPSVVDLEAVRLQARAKFPDKLASFDSNVAQMLRDPCPRSKLASYFVHLVASNGWRFVQ